VRRTLIALLFLGFIGVPASALACPVCFGQSDSPMAWGTNMAIFFMLGLTVAVLGAFAAFFVYLMRRANLTPEADGSADREQYILRSTGPVLHASEPRFVGADAAQRGTTRW
jgi:hypothetical protein